MKNFILLMILSLLVVCQTKAQTVDYKLEHPVSIGIFANFDQNWDNASFKALPGIPNCCPNFSDGIGYGLSGGIMADFSIMKKLLLNARLGLYTISTNFNVIETSTTIFENQTETVKYHHTLDTKLSMLALELMLGYEVYNNLYVHAGINGGGFVERTFNQAETILDPANITYTDGTRTRNIQSGTIPNSNGLRLFIVGGLSYDLPLDNRNTNLLSPEVFFQYGINNIVPSLDWKIYTLRFGLSLKTRL